MIVVKYALGAVLIYVFLSFAVYFLQENIIFLGEEIDGDYQFDFGFPYEEVFIPQDHGAVVHGLLLKSEMKTNKVILYFHGNGQDVRRWAILTQELTKFGYDVFLVDYRGYGKSRGKRTETLLHKDALAAYDYLIPRYGNNITIFGRSLGTGFAVQLAAKRRVDQLILETPFYSLLDVAPGIFKIFPLRWLARFKLDSYKYLKEVDVPITIFHGTNDRIVPISSGLKLAELGDIDNINFIKIMGGKHNNLDSFALYHSELERILTEIQ